jgi:prophage antirepressor-like protein
MTPQTELALNNLFDGKEIRVLENDHDIWFPLTDIASAWGIDRSTPDKIIERNEDVFFGLSNTVLDAASTPLKCLNERGLYLLMGKISAAHLKNVEAKKTIIRFQRWFPELVQKYRKKEIVQTTLVLQTPIDIINERLDIADIAVKRSGVPKEIAHAMAWATGDVKEISLSISGYIKAQSQQLMLPEGIPQDKKDYDMYFSLTKVAASLKLPIDKVRNVLESLNIIYFENGYWKLTAHGMQYGKVFMVTPGYPYRANQKAYIKYNPMAIDLLKKYFAVDTTVLGMPEMKVE